MFAAEVQGAVSDALYRAAHGNVHVTLGILDQVFAANLFGPLVALDRLLLPV